VLIGVSVVIVGTLIGLVVAAEVASTVKGCGSVDPTDPANYSQITIVNDEPDDVIVSSCRGAYCTRNGPVRLAPGRRFAGDAACGASGGDMTSWEVTTDRGIVLGFIAVDSPRKNDDLIFRVSRSSPNRRTPTPAG
jgi:hypothetical protein